MIEKIRQAPLLKKSSHTLEFAQLRVASKTTLELAICGHRIYLARWMYHPFSFLLKITDAYNRDAGLANLLLE